MPGMSYTPTGEPEKGLEWPQEMEMMFGPSRPNRRAQNACYEYAPVTDGAVSKERRQLSLVVASGTIAPVFKGARVTPIGHELRSIIRFLGSACVQEAELYVVPADPAEMGTARLLHVWAQANAMQTRGRSEQPLEVARRMARETPAVPVEPFRVDLSNEPASDLRRNSGLTIRELAMICRVSARRYHDWLAGEAMTAEHETRVLRMGHLMGVLAEALGPSGVRRWLRSPHRKLGESPLKALEHARDDSVYQLIERLTESPAT